MYELNRHFKWFAEREEADWHKLRVLATYVVQPHSKKRLKPRDLIPLPSDLKRGKFVRSENAEKDIALKTQLFLKHFNKN